MNTSSTTQTQRIDHGSIAERALRPLEVIRFGVLKTFYETILILLSADAGLHEAVCSSLRRNPSQRILVLGRNGIFFARAIALHCPDAKICFRTRWPILWKLATHLKGGRPANLGIADPRSKIRSGAAFDHIVLTFALNSRAPEEKAHLLDDLLRFLAEDGWLHVIDCDAPSDPSETKLLSVLSYLHGSAAVNAHLDGKWTESLNSAGSSQVRRRGCVAISGTRIAVVTARKRNTRRNSIAQERRSEDRGETPSAA